MAKQTYRSRLTNAHNTYREIQTEVEDFNMVIGNLQGDSAKSKAIAMLKRAQVSLKEMETRRAYYLGKALEEDAKLFNDVLDQLLA